MTSTTSKTSSENVTSSFCNNFVVIQSHYVCKMCSNNPGIKLEPVLLRQQNKIEHLTSYVHVVHTTTKQVISSRRKNENLCKMYKNGKCTCKACKTIVFRCQICKFVTFWLPSSSWLRKLPNT